LKGTNNSPDELNVLLNSLNISIDSFEESIKKLNIYRLLRTLKSQRAFVFVLLNPLTFREFVDDDLFVRDFILKTSGMYYQSLLADNYHSFNDSSYEDISYKMPLDELDKWSGDNEIYLKKKIKKHYEFNTFFDINVFLKDISVNLLPLRFRNDEILYQIAVLADLYNISYDKMRSFIPKVARLNEEEFDLKLLKKLCMQSRNDYSKLEDGDYNVPCQLFLMNKQDGKEVSPYDKNTIYRLANDYHLPIPVINVLLEYTLNNCNNHLFDSYLYPAASDLHRNNVSDAQTALAFLGQNQPKKDELPVYDDSNNPSYDEKRFNELMAKRGK